MGAGRAGGPGGRAGRALIALVLTALLVAACGGDDGEGVRDVGGTGGTGASPSGTGASGSGSGSASAPATTAAGGAGAGGGAPAASAACKPVGGTGGRAVTVVLDEFSVSPRPASGAPGRVTFKAANRGRAAHQLLVVRTASPSALPTGANGGVDTARLPRGDLVGALEPFGAGRDCTLTVDLTPGTYALLCNIVAGGDAPVSHFQRGMVNVFTVA